MPDSPKLLFGDLIDVVSKSGLPKATCLRDIKHREEYSTATDFYKKVRERIVKTHEKGLDKQFLKQVLTELTDPNKASSYPGVVKGHNKWRGNNTFEWFGPPSAVFTHQGVEVGVKPELGLVVDGERHIVKLYLRTEKLTKNRVEVAIQLMERCLRTDATQGERMSVLDVRRSKLLTGKGHNDMLDALLLAELSWVAAMWPKV